MMKYFLFFIFTYPFLQIYAEESVDVLLDFIGNNNSNKIISTTTLTQTKKCLNVIKCRKLYYLKRKDIQKKSIQPKVNIENKILDSVQTLEIAGKIQEMYNKDNVKFRLIFEQIIKLLLENSEPNNAALQIKLYSLAMKLYHANDYKIASKIFDLSYHKYKNEINGYYFLLGLLNSTTHNSEQDMCKIDSSGLSFQYLIKFNHDYARIFHKCNKY